MHARDSHRESCRGEPFTEPSGVNKRVSPEVIFEAHAVKTAVRAGSHDHVRVVHDTIEFRFGEA